MTAGERFHRFLEKAKWKRLVSKKRIASDSFPDFIQEEIRKEWSTCLCFRGEYDWSNMASEGADNIIKRYAWLSPFKYELQQAISNY